jgi:hypothetical protein
LSARPSPKPWRPDPTHCSGCGVALQFDDNKKAGFAYRQKDPAEGTVERWRKRQSINDVFDDVMKDLDESMLAKLRNTQDNLKDLESKEQVKLRREEEELMEDEDEEFDEDIESHDSPKLVDAIATHKIKDIKPLCLRCHEITFHSNPLNHTLQNLPVHQSIDTIIKNIRNTNRDPSNPPLLVHVLDVADFPLSFIPFDIPTGSKVLFVVNRADILCSQSSALARLRPYFKTQIAKAIQDNNMSIRDYDIHPISAKKGWGTKELLNRIFQLRNAESNVYFIGTFLYRR